MKPLRRRMLAELKLKGREPNTHKTYIDAVARFAAYYGRSPELLGKNEVRRYLLYLIEEEHLARATTTPLQVMQKQRQTSKGKRAS